MVEYLAIDKESDHQLSLGDDVTKLNIKLSNKFYDLLGKNNRCVIRRCSETNVLLPLYLLKERDRVDSRNQILVNHLNVKGWPCILMGTNGTRVHHSNEMHDMICKGYSEESQTSQKLCGQYINEMSLNLSSVFEKLTALT